MLTSSYRSHVYVLVINIVCKTNLYKTICLVYGWDGKMDITTQQLFLNMIDVGKIYED